MINPKTNDNHRKGIDRWNDEGGALAGPHEVVRVGC